MPEISPDFWSKLQDFGFSAMAAGAQPGATTIGALGQAGLAINEGARARALQNAQMASLEQDMLTKQLTNAQAVRGINARNAFRGIPEINPSGIPPELMGRKPASSVAGMSSSPTAGYAVEQPESQATSQIAWDSSRMPNEDALAAIAMGYQEPTSGREARAALAWEGITPEGSKYLENWLEANQFAADKAKATLPYDLQKAAAGATRVQNNIQAYAPFNEKLQGQMAEALVEDYKVLQDAPNTISYLQEAKALVPKAYTGAGAEIKLNVSKLWNSTLGDVTGLPIDPETVGNSDYLRSTLFRQVLENLKKMDAQPSERQQQALQQAMGSLSTDPKALDKIIDLTSDILTNRVTRHNRHVDEAKGGGATFGYDIRVPLPDRRSGRTPTANKQPDRMPTPQTEAEFNALPSGTIYIDPDDGQQYRKP